MSKNLSDLNENLELLSFLFKEEQILREDFAINVHALAGKFIGSKFFLVPLKSEDEIKNTAVKSAELALQSGIDDLKNLIEQIYPRTVTRIGLIDAFLKQSEKLAEKYQLKINLITSITERLQIDIQQEVELYKLCSEITEYLCLNSIPEIEIILTQKADTLIVQVTANGIMNRLNTKIENSKKLLIIRARLVFLKADISDETDWLNYFELKFQLIKKTEA